MNGSLECHAGLTNGLRALGFPKGRQAMPPGLLVNVTPCREVHPFSSLRPGTWREAGPGGLSFHLPEGLMARSPSRPPGSLKDSREEGNVSRVLVTGHLSTCRVPSVGALSALLRKCTWTSQDSPDRGKPAGGMRACELAYEKGPR